ncbi:MAG: hypothetical protein ABIV94_03185, partial [Acidimicrobiales bacterium]
MTTTAGYDFHGVQIVARAPGSTAIDALDRRLGMFRAEPAARPDVRFEFGAAMLEAPPGRSRPVYDAPGAQVAYFESTDELYVEYLGVRLLCAPGRGLVRLSWPRGDTTDVWLATHPLLTIAFIEVLKRRRRFNVHAACAATADGGALVAGPSGAGKSTLAVALALAGWEFLSDDMVFLATEGPGVDILGFPDEVDVTDTTVAMFPELRAAARAPVVQGRDKASLRLEDLPGVRMRLRCRPAVLVLAAVAHSGHSTLAPVSAAEALVELAPNVLLTEAGSVQAHLG